MKKKQSGRPRKAAGEKRERYLQVRISEDEKATFDSAAGRSGLELSQWVRMKLLSAARSEK
jgi:antitoxin component of RelBE/YafQ-DinJ toxin-antitoxin module